MELGADEDDEEGKEVDIAWGDADTSNGGAVPARDQRIDSAKSGSLMAVLGIGSGQAVRAIYDGMNYRIIC